MWYAYKDLVKFKFPRTANEMYHLRDAAPIKREMLEKGDLVFFRINNRGPPTMSGFIWAMVNSFSLRAPVRTFRLARWARITGRSITLARAV